MQLFQMPCHRKWSQETFSKATVLDEATSALDGPTEAALYAALAAACPCVVSVGHRRELVARHTHVLRALGGGRWEMLPAAEYQG